MAAVFADLPFGEAKGTVVTKNMKIMENLLEILTNEEKSFEFKWYVYAMMPVALIAIMALASWIMNAIGYGCY